MKILFDQGTPAPLRHELLGHEVVTASEKGWSALSNGDLLAAAEGSFDLFITTDQNLSYQQNLAGRSLSIVVPTTTSWPRIKASASLVRVAVNAALPGGYQEVDIP